MRLVIIIESIDLIDIIIGWLKISKIFIKDFILFNYNSSELCKFVEYSFLLEYNYIDIYFCNGLVEVNMLNVM